MAYISITQSTSNVTFSDGTVKIPTFLLFRFPLIMEMLNDQVSFDSIDFIDFSAETFDIIFMTLYGLMRVELLPLGSYEELFATFDKVIKFSDFLLFDHDEYVEFFNLFGLIEHYNISDKVLYEMDREKIVHRSFNEHYHAFKEWIRQHGLMNTQVKLVDEEKEHKEWMERLNARTNQSINC
jgi:hypothetical protein